MTPWLVSIVVALVVDLGVMGLAQVWGLAWEEWDRAWDQGAHTGGPQEGQWVVLVDGVSLVPGGPALLSLPT